MNILEFIEKYVTIIDKKTRKKSKFYPSDLQRCLLLAWENAPMSFVSSRQTGMTDDRMKGFQKMRELKNSGKHRLDQVIKVRYI
jgi:hypothetical protein